MSIERRARAAHILAILREALNLVRANAQDPDDVTARWYADCALWRWRIGGTWLRERPSE